MPATVSNPSAQNSTSAVLTFSPTVTATTIGRSYVCAIGCVTKTRTIASVAAGAQNFAQLCGTGSASAGCVFLWWLPSITSSFTTYTITCAGGLTTRFQVGMFEVAGLNGVVDGAGSATNHTVAATTGSETYTTTLNHTFLVSSFSALTAPTSVNSPFTNQAGAGGAGGLAVSVATNEVSIAGSQTSTWNCTSEVSTTALAALQVRDFALPIERRDSPRNHLLLRR